MRERNAERPRSGWRALSLVEFQVAMVVAGVLILGVYSMTIVPLAAVTKDSLLDERTTGDIDAAFTFLGNLVTPGMATGTRLFAISDASGGPVPDGSAGINLYVPYSNAANDLNIFAQNGALVATQGPQTTTIVPAGVTTVSFTAVMAGSPPVRSGAVLCTLSVLDRDATYVYSTTVLPRNQ